LRREISDHRLAAHPFEGEVVEAGEVAEAVGDEPAAVDLHATKDMRSGAEEQVGTGLDRNVGEFLGIAAVLAEVRLLFAG
jgi:hypothetical protein